ncbi:hypothetical protein, partial [Pseudomonas asiatica]|uniref:hypothetical protein n=1 Tax=Pseudomonas asiatica TaxID=2219225 RepID=UPI0019D6A93F
GEGHLFHHRKARRLVSGDFAKSGSLFQDFPKGFYETRGDSDNTKRAAINDAIAWGTIYQSQGDRR